MRILVCGGRNFDDISFLFKYLDNFIEENSLEYVPVVIISGMAPGADSFAEQWAKSNEYRFEGYPADWKTHGKKAGYLRNKQMLDEGKPDYVIAFPGGAGTAMMVRLARSAGIPVNEVGAASAL